MEVKVFTFNDFQENTILLYDESKEAVIIDPGCYYAEEKKELQQFITAKSLKVVRLLNTHCHVDHVLGNQFVKETYGVKLSIHKKDSETLEAVKAYATSMMWGGFDNYEAATVDDYLEEGDKVKFGNTVLEVLFCPGHAPGHIVFYNPNAKTVIGGDVLFFESIGRTDLPGGNHEQLLNSVRTKLFTLPDNTVVYPGHMQTTTIGHEKKFNPFFQ